MWTRNVPVLLCDLLARKYVSDGRDEFAPKINKPQASQMPQEELEGVAEESVRDYYDEVDDELINYERKSQSNN